ncbi:MAG: hypothetical protein HY228_00260, partial [Candidatus Yonathbacteria bacterium]|nr:hypothetical protein [Candidatus Yonathbacteria bacterium]
MYTYTILNVISWAVVAIVSIVLIIRLARSSAFREIFWHRYLIAPVAIIIVATISGIYSYKTYAPDFAMPPFMHTMAPGGFAPYLPLKNVLKFFQSASDFERVA